MRRSLHHVLALGFMLGALQCTLPGALQAAPVASPQSAWGATPGAEPCGAETQLASRLLADPNLAARRELFEQLYRQAVSKGIIPDVRNAKPGTVQVASPAYTIPVAVHIVHQGGPENISDNQVLSQIAALNRDCQNLLSSGAPAANASVQFCLAQNLPPSSPVVWSTTNGITRTNSAQTFHVFGSSPSEVALKAIDYLPSDKYLNIWVVKQISGGSGGVVGYATFPGTVPMTLDGIVMAYFVFGSNTTGYGTFSNLLPSNNDGKVLAHEVGHWLNLLHTFTLGCTSPGDQVSDTPPEQVNNSGCPSGPVFSCTTQPDPVENFMDYTNDACRFAFTSGQVARMQLAINAYRSSMTSPTNLVNTGCSNGLTALIAASPGQICPGGLVNFTTPTVGGGYTYLWSFQGGTPATATTQNASATFSSVGPHIVTLTVTNPANNSSTATTTIYVVNCSPILTACSNWVFSGNARLNFSTGVPVFVNGTQNVGAEAAGQISNSSGALQFYSDADKVWSANNTVMPNGTGIFGGTSSHNGAIVVPRPGSSTQHFLFTISQQENNLVPNPVRITTVDMSLNAGNGDVVVGLKNIPVVLPGSPQKMLEGQTLIPHCNGVDWWYITHGASTWAGTVYVTLVTSAGAGASVSYPIGLPGPIGGLGAITATRDGSKVGIVSWETGQIRIYDFSRTTGVISLSQNLGALGGYQDLAFSPNGKVLYYSYFSGSVFGLRQIDLTTLQVRDIAVPGPERDVELGPDGRVYVGVSNGTSIGCINSPDNFNTFNANECAYNPASVPLGTGQDNFFGPLPNTLQMCSGVQPAQFTYTITNCTTVNFHSLNCGGPWSWNFGDATTGSGQNVPHTYSGPGTYNVTLTVSGASPPSVVIPVTISLPTVTIAGPTMGCKSPSNYSTTGSSSWIYNWTITGGLPTSYTGNNVDVNWASTGGTISVLVTDPSTGCTYTTSLNVAPCDSCFTPPLGMVAWWPLDETSGLIAQDIMGGNNGLDINSPIQGPGKVLNSLRFNGSTNYVRVNDAPQLNMAFSNLTLDAWVKTEAGAGGGTMMIVAKHLASPFTGYALYLKQGRLALRLGDGSSVPGVEYWSSTTPFIADANWHHVAATEDRSNAASGTRLYVDGVMVASFSGFNPSGNINNTEKLLIGAGQPWATPVAYFNGKIDEVEIFNLALTAGKIQGLYLAGSHGKCKEYCQVPWDQAICLNQSSLVVPMQICNFTSAPQTYNVGFSGLPMGYQGAAGGCSWNGPSTFTVLSPSMPVTVAPNTCITIQVKIDRPVGMPAGTVACYQMILTNVNSNIDRICTGSIWASNTLCPRPWVNVNLTAGLAQVVPASWVIRNTSPKPFHGPYSVMAMGMDPVEPMPLSLNGLPPGVPWIGDLSLAPGESTVVTVDVAFTDAAAFRFFDLILGMDSDGDGSVDVQSSIGIRYVQSSGGTVAVPAHPQVQFALMPIMPNPFARTARVEFDLPQRGRVRLGVFDVAGRQLKTLVDGPREAGHGFVTLRADDLPSGTYFVRLQMGDRVVSRQVVLLK